MTAITDTRKRSRDEDICDFMPISKRINNLTLTSQNLGEHDLPNGHNLNGNNIASDNHQFMVNNQEIQSQHFAQSSILNSYPNGMSHHYQNHNGQATVLATAHNPNYHHQSHILQSTNHSNGFQNNSHLVLGNKQNDHHHHQQQMHNEESNNNQMEDVYRPELTADENPFYYDKNKLLFDLHVERQRRHQSQ